MAITDSGILSLFVLLLAGNSGRSHKFPARLPSMVIREACPTYTSPDIPAGSGYTCIANGSSAVSVPQLIDADMYCKLNGWSKGLR
ncbi:uncharacterized protein FFMR_03823 [Fusarium fujikuroi]|nr:uncharacterized protein FFE2_13581 [Fusarium fujikuroi]SCO23730.1 uncharacterized protein FFM5_13437 [Fusarium fujikuroi]SCO35267.1 uncharacterized protein FFMR_03823 [Fusarium fujikuroi]SCV59014.1 uncharacterized protein FFFS_13583 [Fusarium fujikuroi]